MIQEFKPTHTINHTGERVMFIANDPLFKKSSVVYHEDSIGYLQFAGYPNEYLIPIQVQLTPTQMLEAAQAKGIVWTKEWPKVSGWHVCDFAGRSGILRWVDVDKKTISIPVSYRCCEIQAAQEATTLSGLKNSDFSFAKPWWVQE